MQTKKIVFLAADFESSRWVYHGLSDLYKFDAVIVESPVSRKIIFSNRIKKIGFRKVFGQALFSIFIVPLLRKSAKKRRFEIIENFKLNNNAFPPNTIWVKSVNNDQCKDLLIKIQPDIVIVNGTRIIKKDILDCCKALFINMHVGITPWYRGSHGGYWALYYKDPTNFGTSIHLVDTGVDTGGVLQQAFITPEKKDNFTTYPILQVAIGIEALRSLLPLLISGEYQVKNNKEKGRLYYQPGIFEYLFNKTK